MKFDIARQEGNKARRQEGRCLAASLPRCLVAFSSSIFELRSSRQRRGSVLVLVMTILGILFVVGVAFLATMNFEADMIVSETQNDRTETRVAAAVDQLGSALRDGLMSDPRIPFGNPSVALSPTAYAEMPGVHTSISGVEPHWDPGPDGILGNADDLLVFSPYADVAALRKQPFAGPTLPQGFAIDTRLSNGGMMTQLPNGNPIQGKCLGGVNKGASCDYVPGECPGSVCEGPRVLDADGDGIVDSLQVDATALDFSDAQFEALAARLNPASNPGGRVFVGIRVLPHGGLVNLNASHPKLIENVLDVSDLRNPPDPDRGYFYHRPTHTQASYSPLLEERSLRRRGFLAPKFMPPSWLLGDPLVSPAAFPAGRADMQWQLFPPRHDSPGFETVFDHRYWPFMPTELFPDYPEPVSYWAVRMEPFTAAGVDPTGYEYDRRHLVTTVSHDDLLARGGRVSNPNVPSGEEDVLAKMTQANQTAWDPDVCPALLPFEYVDYPQTIANPPDAGGAPCCPTDLSCKLNARKGRLQLSLPYLDDQIDAANRLTDPIKQNEAWNRVIRLIHDAFFLLVRNAARVTTLEGTLCSSNVDCAYANAVCGAGNRCTVAPPSLIPFKCASAADCSIPGSACRADGICTIQAPYWQDATTAAACNAPAGETWNAVLSQCLDAWTGQTRSQALVSRTAAALTANLIDYADADDNPTRIPLRSLDLSTGLCISPPLSVGFVCEMDANCGNGGICLPPRGMCVRGENTKIGRVCGSDAACGAGGLCVPPANAAGREFDFDAGLPFKPQYVYGLERQPYITEIATLTMPGAGGPPAPPSVLVARAVELFNPYSVVLDLNGYSIVEVDVAGTAKPAIVLSGTLPPDSFIVFASGNTAGLYPLATPLTPALQFENGWTIYLIRRVDYPGAPNTEIVVDQFEVPLDGNVGNTDPAIPVGIYSSQRMVTEASPWTATVPQTDERPIGIADLGNWNTYAPLPPPHPVEVNFANLGSFTRPFVSADARNGSVSFPTTGSMLMLMRHANRAWADGTKFTPGVAPQLSFTPRLVDVTPTEDSMGVPVLVEESQQIDNGRMPVFDIGQRSANDQRYYAAHHVSPSETQLDAPGNLDTLPWGQLVFDYFTALPLSSPGPYVDIDPGPDVAVALPDSRPRVDLDGLRVHGRININAAPWKVLSGLPFVPMQKIPLAYKASIRRALGFVKEASAPNWLNPAPTDLEVLDDQAARIGTELAQAIVAYRDLRTIPTSAGPGTGNYADGTPTVEAPSPAAPIAYARGWNNTAPMARRGTGFMSVGELANVRHLGAELLPPPHPTGYPKSYYRIDAGVIGISSLTPCTDPTPCTPLGEVCDASISKCIRRQNYVEAVAALAALGDWITVRSQVFTVYGILRGEEDQTIIDPDPSAPPTLAELQARDADSRALRFQETFDRLPTFLGEPVPPRIGDRTLTRYTDVRND